MIQAFGFRYRRGGCGAENYKSVKQFNAQTLLLGYFYFGVVDLYNREYNSEYKHSDNRRCFGVEFCMGVVGEGFSSRYVSFPVFFLVML